MREHPLTARVAVNRIWQMLFGAGLVRTPADFGAQGEYPTHPELLDWLAVDFMDNGWNTKRLVRQIVTSATYRQSSDSNADSLSRDPANRLLARGPRFRLPAEFIRDSALKISGLLVDRLGGPSVNPYTPGNLWREISHYGSTPATAQTFEQDHGEKLYRRSLYTYWKRTVPPPNMVTFDAPNRESCTVARPSTTTPLQALVLLNDVQFVEASRAFAERIIAHASDDADRVRWAFAEAVSRRPSEAELTVLMNALDRERTRYATNEDAARKYLANGESPRNDQIPAAEHAAWSQIAALLLNLSETITHN
jgi:HEAT repeat protein